MLCSTLKKSSFFEGYADRLRELLRILKPDWMVTVETVPVLAYESFVAKFSNGLFHKDSCFRGAPYHPNEGIRGRVCTETFRRPQVSAKKVTSTAALFVAYD